MARERMLDLEKPVDVCKGRLDSTATSSLGGVRLALCTLPLPLRDPGGARAQAEIYAHSKGSFKPPWKDPAETKLC